MTFCHWLKIQSIHICTSLAYMVFNTIWSLITANQNNPAGEIIWPNSKSSTSRHFITVTSREHFRSQVTRLFVPQFVQVNVEKSPELNLTGALPGMREEGCGHIMTSQLMMILTSNMGCHYMDSLSKLLVLCVTVASESHSEGTSDAEIWCSLVYQPE